MVTVKTPEGTTLQVPAQRWTVSDNGHLHLYGDEGALNKKTVASFAPGSWAYVREGEPRPITGGQHA